MDEILPGVYHWTARHERIGIDVSSYLLAGERVLFDPMVPADGLAWFERHGAPTHILLSNRHHYRHSTRFVEAFGCVVHCHRAGLHEFTHGEAVEPFEFGDTLPGGVVACEVGAICPEETAFYSPAHRLLSFADGIVRMEPRGPLGFVPDHLLGADPATVKAGLRASVTKLLDLDFETVLLAHGDPVVGGGRDRLRAFTREGS
jgi:hypothetical protein